MINLDANPRQLVREYEINQAFGFLPQNEPLKRLPSYFSPWEIILDSLTSLLRSNNLRPVIKRLPLLSIDNLKGIDEFRRAFLVLSFLTHAYVFGNDDQDTLQVLHRSLAIPYCLVANQLRMKPVVCASAVCLWNYTIIDSSKPAELDNLKVNHTFTQTRDEEWFYLVTTSIELLGGQCITLAINILSLISNEDATLVQQEQISSELKKLTKLIQKINVLMLRMYDYCDPKIFYNQIRPFLSGWLNMEQRGLPKGLYYEGTENMWNDGEENTNLWRKFAGGSAGQSPLIQFLDIFLGIEHYPTLKEWKEIYLKEKNIKRNYITYLMEMREYMSGGHRQLLYDLSDTKNNTRSYVSRINELIRDTDHSKNFEKTIILKEIVDNYNMCVNGMKSFRNIHLQIVGRYIVMQTGRANKALQNNNPEVSAEVRGTGGTDLIPFLKQCRDETSIHLINKQ